MRPTDVHIHGGALSQKPPTCWHSLLALPPESLLLPELYRGSHPMFFAREIHPLVWLKNHHELLTRKLILQLIPFFQDLDWLTSPLVWPKGIDSQLISNRVYPLSLLTPHLLLPCFLCHTKPESKESSPATLSLSPPALPWASSTVNFHSFFLLCHASQATIRIFLSSCPGLHRHHLPGQPFTLTAIAFLAHSSDCVLLLRFQQFLTTHKMKSTLFVQYCISQPFDPLPIWPTLSLAIPPIHPCVCSTLLCPLDSVFPSCFLKWLPHCGHPSGDSKLLYFEAALHSLWQTKRLIVLCSPRTLCILSACPIAIIILV